MVLKDGEKVIFLQLILKHKDVIMGKFSDSLTKYDKEAAWRSIVDECRIHHGFEILTTGKNWTYARDHIWPTIKTTTMSKIDKYKKTGAEGTWKARLNAVENAVLDIVGPDSPVVEGISVTNPLETVGDWAERHPSDSQNRVMTAASLEQPRLLDVTTVPPSPESSLISSSHQQDRSGSSNERITPSSAPRGESTITLNECEVLKKRKIEAEIRKIEAEIRKIEAESRELDLRIENCELQNERLRLELEQLRDQE